MTGTVQAPADVALDLGWGRLLFGQTFADYGVLLEALRAEESGRRDIAMYVGYPQVLLGLAPSELFIDPSLTYRLVLDDDVPDADEHRPRVRRLDGAGDVEELNRIYAMNHMVAADPDVVLANAAAHEFVHLLAVGDRG